MSSTNKTPNYALPQFIPTDKPTWLGDVNAAMLAIDTAMADNHTTAESANTSASAAVAQVQHAVDTANEAKVDSAAALQNATNAIGVAQNALNSATQATQTAQAATQTANAANNSAASAVATANQAKQTADATDAELTEFQHNFSIFLPNLLPAQQAKGNIVINPAFLQVDMGGIFNIGTERIPFFKINGDALGYAAADVGFDVSDNLTVYLEYNQQDDTTTFSVVSKTPGINARYELILGQTYDQFKILNRKNPRPASERANDRLLKVVPIQID